MRPSTLSRLLAAALLLATTALPAAAADRSVEVRLDARGTSYQIDEDGDYMVVVRFGEENRTQLVYVSGRTESVSGLIVREVFSPAAHLGRDRVDGAKALELLRDSRQRKIGAWEISGDLLYYVIKLPDSADALQLDSAILIAAEVADDAEIEFSGDADTL